MSHCWLSRHKYSEALHNAIVETIIEAFDFHDKNYDGYINLDELNNGLALMDPTLRKSLYKVMEAMDADNDLKVSKQEWKDFWLKPRADQPPIVQSEEDWFSGPAEDRFRQRLGLPQKLKVANSNGGRDPSNRADAIGAGSM